MTISNKIERFRCVNEKIVNAINADDEDALRIHDRESHSILQEILDDHPTGNEEILQTVELLLSLIAPAEERSEYQHQIVSKITSLISQVLA
jgi:hypothetical protein